MRTRQLTAAVLVGLVMLLMAVSVCSANLLPLGEHDQSTPFGPVGSIEDLAAARAAAYACRGVSLYELLVLAEESASRDGAARDLLALARQVGEGRAGVDDLRELIIALLPDLQEELVERADNAGIIRLTEELEPGVTTPINDVFVYMVAPSNEIRVYHPDEDGGFAVLDPPVGELVFFTDYHVFYMYSIPSDGGGFTAELAYESPDGEVAGTWRANVAVALPEIPQPTFAIDAPEAVPQSPEIPTFTIDPDVTRDSVVQIGNGPQVLSTDIKFYPNTRRAKPGDTVYWTLEIGEESDLEPPFTIVPEMNNDASPEDSLGSLHRSFVIAHEYGTSAVYIPYLTLADSTGRILTIYTHNVLGVIPELKQHARIGLDLPTLEDPEGDVVKSIQLFEIDQDLLRTDSGRSFLAERFRRYRDDGMNFVMFNCLTLVSGLKDNICMPIYGETDSFFQDTLTIDSLIGLAELAGEEGLMIGFRPLIGNTQDWSGVEHFGYAPTSKLLYFSFHVQMKQFFAEVCEAIGVDVFNIDTENIVTTTSTEAIAVIEAVREVFTGVIGDTPVLDDSALQRGVLYPYLDYIHFSHASNFDPTYSADEIEVVFRLLVENELLPTVNETGKPCLIETFARYEPSYPGFQREAYEGMLRVLQDDLGFIIGISFWEDHLRTTTTSVFTPIGRSAESVLGEYFNSLIPDSRTYSFTHTAQDYRRGTLIEEFENPSVPNSFFIAASGGEASFAVDASVSYSLGHSLKVTFSNASSNGEFAYFWVGEDLGRPTSWETFDALSLAIRHSGDLDSIIINVFDQDGDRFIIDRGILQGKVPTWETVIAPLGYFVQPAWAEHGDGHMDWTRVVSWAILGRYFNGPSINSAWIDRIELVNGSR